MTTVIDASAVIDLLLLTPRADALRAYLAGVGGSIVTVAHADAEVLSGLARLHRAGKVAADDIDVALRDLAAFPMQRLPIAGPLLHDAWSRRDNVATKDALYVAAADVLGVRLLTTDDRLARAVPELAVQLWRCPAPGVDVPNLPRQRRRAPRGGTHR